MFFNLGWSSCIGNKSWRYFTETQKQFNNGKHCNVPSNKIEYKACGTGRDCIGKWVILTVTDHSWALLWSDIFTFSRSLKMGKKSRAKV